MMKLQSKASDLQSMGLTGIPTKTMADSTITNIATHQIEGVPLKRTRSARRASIKSLDTQGKCEMNLEDKHLNITSDFFNCQIRNRDIAEDFHLESTYDNILGSGKFSEVRKLRHKHTNRIFAVKTFRLPVMNEYDKNILCDIEKLMIWDQIIKLR